MPINKKGDFFEMNINELERLASLKEKGILTEREFEDAKRKILESEQNLHTEVKGNENIVINNNINTFAAKKVTIGTILGYIFGVCFILSGIFYLLQLHILSGVLTIIAGVIIVPYINDTMEKKLNFKLSGGLRFIVCVILLIISGFNLSSTTDKTASSTTSSDLNKTGQSQIQSSGEAVKNIIEFGKTLTIKDICDVTAQSFEYTNKVQPKSPNEYYIPYYEVEDKTSNTYLHLIVNYKNLASQGIRIGELFSLSESIEMSLLYKDNFEYTSFCKADGESGYGYTIDPLKTGVLHFVSEIPLEVKNSKDPLKAIFKINGEKYYLNIR